MKNAKRLPVVVLMLALLFSAITGVIPSVSALGTEYAESVSLTKNESYTKNGKFYMRFTIRELTDYYGLRVTPILYNSAGKQITKWNMEYIPAGEVKGFGFGRDYSSLPSGVYTMKLTVDNTVNAWIWSYKIKHTAPARTAAYKSYETYYDKNGKYYHKVNIQCKNLKGYKLYCEIYNEYGELMYDWGTDTPSRKTNNEVGYFAWSGYVEGVKQPSGNYTFIITNSADNRVVEKTLKLTIPEVGRA